MLGDRRAFDSLLSGSKMLCPASISGDARLLYSREARSTLARGSTREKLSLVEHSTDNREAVSSILTSRTRLDAEKMSWRARRSHKPPLGRVRFPPPQPWGRRSTGGLLVCTQPMRVRFSPSPPSLPA